MLRRIALFLLVMSAVSLPVVAAASPALRLLILVLGMAGAFLWAVAMIFEHRIVLPWGWGPAAGLVVLIVGIVSGILSDCPQAALVTLLTWAGYASGFLLAFWTGKDAEMRRRIVRALCAIALPIAILGILQYAFMLDQLRAEIEMDPTAALRKTGMTERDLPALLQRTIDKRVFSTFVLPNSLAGFLVLLIPPSVLLLVSARRGVPRLLLGGSLAVLLLGLFFTFSKGGWLAGALVLLVFLVSRGRAWLPRRWRPMLGVVLGIGVLFAAALISFPRLMEHVTATSSRLGPSAAVRLQYWAAGVGMWRSHPVFGVGPGNFENHYTRHMSVASEETTHAHNDYVELLAECGPLAAAAYVAFWLIAFTAAIRRRESPVDPEPTSRVPRGLFPTAGVLGVVLAAFCGAALTMWDSSILNLLSVAVFAALWWLAYWLSGRYGEGGGRHSALTVALLFGLLGFVLHSAVDLNLYVEGLAYVAFIAAGLATASWGRARTFHPAPRGQLCVLIATCVCSLAILYVASRASLAGSHRAYADAVLKSSKNPSDALFRADSSLSEACRLNPLDHEAFARQAQVSYLVFRMRHDSRDLDRAFRSWKRAVALNPSFADYHEQFGELLLETARRWPVVLSEYVKEYKALGATFSIPSPALDKFVPALVELRIAVERAPTNPAYHLAYGNGLWDVRLHDEARGQYQAALDLNAAMARDGAPARQRLGDDQLNFLQGRLGLTTSGDGAIIPE